MVLADNPAPKSSSRSSSAWHRILLLAGLLAIGCVALWVQWRSLASAQDTHGTALRQVNQMRVDAEEIKALRQTPKAAASRTRANEELLAQIERSLNVAGFDRGNWQDSIPQPPLRLPQSDYKKLTTRLYFTDISLRKLAAFAHDLHANDPTLHLSALNLTNRHTNTPVYNADLAVSYLVYAPQEAHRRHESL